MLPSALQQIVEDQPNLDLQSANICHVRGFPPLDCPRGHSAYFGQCDPTSVHCPIAVIKTTFSLIQCLNLRNSKNPRLKLSPDAYLFLLFNNFRNQPVKGFRKHCHCLQMIRKEIQVGYCLSLCQPMPFVSKVARTAQKTSSIQSFLQELVVLAARTLTRHKPLFSLISQLYLL